MRRTTLIVATGASMILILVAAALLVRNSSEPQETRAVAERTLSPTPAASEDVITTPSPTSAPRLSIPSTLPTPRQTTQPATPAPKKTVDVLIVNEFSNAVDVQLNATVRKGIKPGEQIAVEVTPEEGGHDAVSVRDTVHTGCGAGDGDNYFDLGSSYKARVYNTGNNCLEGGTRSLSPGLKIERM